MTILACLVEGAGLSRPLSPLFGRARWLVCRHAGGPELWLDNRHRGSLATAGLVIRRGVTLLVVTWIEADSLSLLQASGVDVRLAPATMPAAEALERAADLPQACASECDTLLGC